MYIFSADHIVGRIVRFPLKFLPEGKAVPFLQRSMSGMRWILGSGPHSCWLGIAELSKRRLFEKNVSNGQTVIDVGANVGYYSLMSSKLVGPSGKVLALEPSPRNYQLLCTHLSLNKVSNVSTFKLALSDQCGIARFSADIDPVAQRLSESGNIEVHQVTLDQFVADHSIEAIDIIKIDVEGAELKVLKGAQGVLRKHRPKLFVETHDRFEAKVHENCKDFLEKQGYEVQEIANCELYAEYHH